MPSNIFAPMEPLLREKKFNIDYDALFAFLKHYHSKSWVYPGAMHRELGIGIKLVYEILELCVDAGLLEQYLDVYCPSCNRFTANAYKSVTEIPEEVYCPHCDEEIKNPISHAIVIYRVKENARS